MKRNSVWIALAGIGVWIMIIGAICLASALSYWTTGTFNP